MDNLLCSEERSVVGDTVSVCERNFQEIVSPESVREEMKRRIDNLRLHYEKH